nr:hypothetical protein [uncultured Flavobacterium sp.]
MALQTLSTIKDWFKTGLKPSQTQFWDTWDSFRHKNDKVPVTEVEGMDELLDQLPPKTIYESGQLLVFKNPGNESGNNFLEPDDTVIGFVEGEFLNAGTYYGGDPMQLSSYEFRLPTLPFIFYNEAELQTIPPEDYFSNVSDLFYHNVNLDGGNGTITSVYQLLDADYNYLGEVPLGPIPVTEWLPVKERTTGELVLEYQIPDTTFFNNLFAPESRFYSSQILIEFSPRDGRANRIVTARIFAGTLDQVEGDNLRSANVFQTMPDEGEYKISELRNTYFGAPQTILKIRYK